MDVPGVEPTNNVAERAIRPAVLSRKWSFGTQSGNGRFAGAMLTVAASYRRHGLDLFTYTAGVCTASMRPCRPPAPPRPRLIPSGSGRGRTSHQARVPNGPRERLPGASTSSSVGNRVFEGVGTREGRHNQAIDFGELDTLVQARRAGRARRLTPDR